LEDLELVSSGGEPGDGSIDIIESEGKARAIAGRVKERTRGLVVVVVREKGRGFPASRRSNDCCGPLQPRRWLNPFQREFSRELDVIETARESRSKEKSGFSVAAVGGRDVISVVRGV